MFILHIYFPDLRNGYSGDENIVNITLNKWLGDYIRLFFKFYDKNM